MTELFADGLYFGLAHAAYLADPALGSSAMNLLSYSPPAYWHQSAYNPARDEPEPTASQVVGTAHHLMILEGRQAFEGRFAPCRLKGNTKDGRTERASIIEAGRLPLVGETFDRIVKAGEILRTHEILVEAFSGGHAEVSVFWTDGDPPMRKKARFDYLKRRAILDLKTVGRTFRRLPFGELCKISMRAFDYPLQARHYCEARQAARDLIGAGAIHVLDGPLVAPDFLEDVANQERWAWINVFVATVGAPESYACQMTWPDSEILARAGYRLEQAEAAFRDCADRFGLDGTPWLRSEPIEELSLYDCPL